MMIKRAALAGALLAYAGCSSQSVDDLSTAMGSDQTSEATTAPESTPQNTETADAATDTASAGTEENTETGDLDEGELTEDDTDTGPTLDERIAALLATQEVPVAPLVRPDPPPRELYDLGEALFFDPILSGNKDIACATCHHPSLASGDGINLSLGTGASGLGTPRQDGPHRAYIARHSPTLFNIGDPAVVNLFWDGRIELLDDGTLRTPANEQLPTGLDGLLAAQALFPLLDRLEMRGVSGDITVLGEPNELAEFDDEARPEIWAAIMRRLGAFESYVELFAKAFPEEGFDELTIVHVANAIAAYEAEAFAMPDSPWDRYLRGEQNALTEDEKLGAFHFYNDEPISGLCATCHAGPLFTDQKFHDTGIPQVGPGHAEGAPYDFGRNHATGAYEDRFLFRTPSLRNVALSAPYMHNGGFESLPLAIRHYIEPASSISNYDGTQLHPDLADSVRKDPKHLLERSETLSELLTPNTHLGALNEIEHFLRALTDPAALELVDLRPDTVPSGLPVP